MSFKEIAVWGSSVDIPKNTSNASSESAFITASRGSIDELKKYHRAVKRAKQMGDQLGSKSDTDTHRAAMHSHFILTKSIGDIVNRRLMRLPSYLVGTETGDSEGSVRNRDNSRHHKIMLQRLQKDYEQQTQDFNGIVSDTRQREKQCDPRALAVAEIHHDSLQKPLIDSQFEGGAGDEGAGLGLGVEHDQLRPVASESEVQGSLLRERNSGIESIQLGMVEMNQMFRDMSKIVAEQSSYVDDIEEQVTSSHDRSKAGLAMISRAAELQIVASRAAPYLLVLLLFFTGSAALWYFFLGGAS